MVLVNHGLGSLNEPLLYPLWIEQAVPLFLLIQVFHAYKKDEEKWPNMAKIWHRILQPFLLIQLTFVGYYLLRCFFKDTDLLADLSHLIRSGGDGPGSYYIWIYLQVAILCPMFYKLVRLAYSFWIFASISLLMELFCSIVQMPDSIYRLLCLRYFFLIYLGYLWCKNGIELTMKSLLLSLASIVSILVLFFTRQKYPEYDFEPLIFDTAWSSFHWFTYFLPWSLLAFVICKFYQICLECRGNKIVLLCGKRSYEIFLWQMLVFGISPLPGNINILVSLLPLVVYERKAIIEIISSKSIYDKRKN